MSGNVKGMAVDSRKKEGKSNRVRGPGEEEKKVKSLQEKDRKQYVLLEFKWIILSPKVLTYNVLCPWQSNSQLRYANEADRVP